MKTITLTISLLLFLVPILNSQETPSDFDYELSNIARNFRNEIMNKDECENLKRDTEDLVDKIGEGIERDVKYTNDEILELKKLKKEANAIKQFIASVGDCGNSIPSIKEFNLANQRIRANVSYVSKNKYCVDIILVEIGDYVAYLAENNTSKNYTLSYKWKIPNSFNSGNGTMGIFKYSMRHFYNNRDGITKEFIKVLSINCNEI